MYYMNRWGGPPFSQLSREDAVGLSLRLLFTASEYDSATGRYESSAGVYPTVKTITSGGQEDIDLDELRALHERFLD